MPEPQPIPHYDPAESPRVKITNPVLGGLAQTYLHDLRMEMPDLREALERKDFTGIAQMAHNYSGSGASHGFTVITHLGQALEYTAEQQQEAAVVALVASFNDFLSRVEVIRE